MLTAKAKVNSDVIEHAKKRMEQRAAKAHPHRVSVGIHETDGAHKKLDYNGHETEATVVEVGAIHEFGDRSWLRTWFDRNRSKLIHGLNDAMKADYKGDHGALEKFGEQCANELREWIEMEDAGLKRLQPSTVAAKQRAGLDRPETPLFATGELVASIKAMIDGEKA